MATLKTDPPITAALDLVAWSEGTYPNPLTKANGYDVIVSGVDGPNLFTDFSVHPFSQGRKPIIVQPARSVEYGPNPDNPTGPPIITRYATAPLLSTASGRYQIVLLTWEELSKAIGLGTFAPAAQDSAALELMTRVGATALFRAGQLAEAFAVISNTWASFPGNLYGQPKHTVDELTAQYARLLANAEAGAA